LQGWLFCWLAFNTRHRRMMIGSQGVIKAAS
jgi:hypothetical protein